MKLLLLNLLLSCTAFLPAQEKEGTAPVQIETLKNGALLVGLKTGALQAKALDKGAAAYLLKVEAENKNIIAAFRKNYHFSPVYFFYTSSAEQVKAHTLKNCLLNDQLKQDTTITPVPAHYLIAEFGSSEEQSIEGLLMMDDQLRQLKPPFPFLIRKYSGVAAKLTPEQMVAKLNKALEEYYNKR
ncbi:MAG: hypothetical protein ACHQRM_05220 [Bacteroidia bacterium]